MSSAVEICNEALGRIGAQPITSLDDASTEAKVCKVLYESELEELLDEHDWRFATTRLEVAADVAEPVYGWGYSYTLPSTVIRVLEADDGTGNLNWQREGNQVMCDNSGPIYLKVITKVTDPSRFPPTFEDALAYRISAEACMPLAQNQALYQFLYQVAERKTKEAQNRDGGQGRTLQATINDLTSARY
jgi:hypothetical protein